MNNEDVNYGNYALTHQAVDKAIEVLTSGKFGNGKRGAQVKALFEGDFAGMTKAAADMSLCNAIAVIAINTTKGDIATAKVLADRIYRHSQLMDDKWDEEKVAVTGMTYGQCTIAAAFENCDYKPVQIKDLPAMPSKVDSCDDDEKIIKEWQDKIEGLGSNAEIRKFFFAKDVCFGILQIPSKKAFETIYNYIEVFLKSHKLGADWKKCFMTYKQEFDAHVEAEYVAGLNKEQQQIYQQQQKRKKQLEFPKTDADGIPVKKDMSNFLHLLNVNNYEIKFNVVTRLVEVYKNGEFNADFSMQLDAFYVQLMLDAKAMHYAYDLTIDLVQALVRLHLMSNQYNPAKEYFDKCKELYDGKPHFDDLWNCFEFTADFQKYLNDNPRAVHYKNAVKKWFVGCVKMAGNDGSATDICCQTMLVLQSDEQNIGKSYLVAHLLPFGLCISRDKFNPDDKDSVYKVTSGTICELPEFAKSLVQIDGIKRFLTERVDVLRRPYGHSESYLPRMCNFIGTLNDDKFLHDTTGNRRFVILPLLSINWEMFDGLDLRQFWGFIAMEADKYNDLHLTAEELCEINKFNETKRVVSDIEQRFYDHTDFSMPVTSWTRRTPSEIAHVIYDEHPPKNAAKDVGIFLSREHKKLGIDKSSSHRQNKYLVPLTI